MTKKSTLEQLEIDMLDAYDDYVEEHMCTPDIAVVFSREGFWDCRNDRLAITQIDTTKATVSGYPYRIDNDQKEKYIIKVR